MGDAVTTMNGGRLLPWADCPKCPTCKMHSVVVVSAMSNGHSGPKGARVACAGCGVGRIGGIKEVAQARRAEVVYQLLLAGKIHEDKGCERCNGPLFLDRFRLCADCVSADNAERQVPMFAEMA